ncbi:MAG: energy-coupled thiamine transporter ThiT [Clostridiales bacterium]|nr:energy-coupled thiamine transporter ThiT [Clostridiales bacterium]
MPKKFKIIDNSLQRSVRTYWLAESAVMIALSVVLEVLSKMFIPKLPFGGSVTLVSMLPVILVCWKYGIRKGLITSFVYSLVEMAMGIFSGTITAAFLPVEEDGLGVGKALLMLLLDYLLAFWVLGFASMFRKVIKKDWLSLALGALVVIFLRYCSHTLSGFILYGAWAEWFFTEEATWGIGIYNALKDNSKLLALAYSAVYNGLYMIPEMIVTPIVAAIIGNIPQITSNKKIH